MKRQPCPRCQTTNPRDSRYCGRCGAALTTQTIIISADDSEPYRVETSARHVQATELAQVVALGAAAVAAELALVYLERRFLRGRPHGSGPLSSDHMRQVRSGAISSLAGAALLFAEQSFGGAWQGRS